MYAYSLLYYDLLLEFHNGHEQALTVLQERHHSAWLTNTLPKLTDRSNLSSWNAYSSSALGNAIPVDRVTRKVTEVPSPILLEPFQSFKAQMVFLNSITRLMSSFFLY